MRPGRSSLRGVQRERRAFLDGSETWCVGGDCDSLEGLDVKDANPRVELAANEPLQMERRVSSLYLEGVAEWHTRIVEDVPAVSANCEHCPGDEG